MFNPDERHKTIYTQYKRDASNLCDLIDRAYEGVRHEHDFSEFYKNFWDIETATGKWLDIWGVIVAVDRFLDIENDDFFFGFDESDREPFNQGIFFNGVSSGTSVYELGDDVFRRVIIAKAMANIAACDTTSLNSILTFFFEGRGKCYIVQNGTMALTYVFEFELEAWEKALFTQRKVFPHPAGVLVTAEGEEDSEIWGFNEAVDFQTFNNGVFYDGVI